ncbi:DNA-binding CsgD family transcriptional regulator [Thermocatellispora tengchongensis]|uniref:DNA-binding CsgD family transcriptional regulator n=1 Tax=Thermocatellispora tengchongensis TaxID=1073253 RepID=A0A840P6I3_9ACTN|nr:LuxR C-terminal-related transcriptional regulator [Thermocatellispora tengchongensis]MBB5136944.1 DNA-binding CsgD family transcriptional regulator [Thermocatellispora tengchongensis]
MKPRAERVQATLARIRSLTGVSLAFAGPVDRDGVLLERFDGPVVGPLSGVRLSFGHGLGGKAASIQRPVVVNDYVRAPHITHQYDRIIQAEGLRAMVAVPVVVAKRTVTVIYAAFRDTQIIGGRIYDVVAGETRTLEHDLVVAHALETIEPPQGGEAAVIEENRRLRAALRDTYTQLRLLAARTADPVIREELLREADRFTDQEAGPPALTLTPRENDVLALVAGGLTNAQIASALGLTTFTVKSYMKSLMGKLGAGSRHEAVVIARRLGRLP